jgi:hypothetical protein
VTKPPEMHVSLVLLILAAVLPGLVGAGLVIVSFGAQSQLDTLASQLNVASGIVSILRAIGAVFFLLAVAYIVFAVIAYRGRNWARILVTVLTALFDIVLILGLVGGSSQTVGGLLVAGGIVLASVIGVVLMYLPKSAAFFAAAGRR